jgi:AraC-like DNA-binding protein
LAFGDQLEVCQNQPILVAASRGPGVELVVVPARDRLGQSLVTTVAAINASRQGAPVYVYADRSAESLRELMPLARAGARGVIVRDEDDDVSSLRSLVARGTFGYALQSVTLAVRDVVATRHLPLVLLCLEHVREPLDASAFARRLRVSRRTLSAWAHKAGARGVRSLASKCRVLIAIEMIRGSARPIESVAHELGFGSSAHLHNTIRRYTGVGPREAAARDAAHWCRDWFTSPAAASGGNASAPAGMADST